MVADDIPPDRMNARPPAGVHRRLPVSDETRGAARRALHSTRDPLPGQALEREGGDPRAHELPRLPQKRRGGCDEARRYVPGPHARLLRARASTRVPALEAHGHRLSGLRGARPSRATEEAVAEMDEPYIHHFPDGNASHRAAARARADARRRARRRRWRTSSPRASTTRSSTSPARRRACASTARRSHVRNRDGGVDVGYVRDGTLHARARRPLRHWPATT